MVGQCLNDVSLINFRLEDITSDENKLQQNSAGLSRATAKHTICRLVRLKATFVLTLDKSLGTGTYAK